MCKVYDIAIAITNYSIDYSNEKNDESYLVDFYKIHKLLYYAQGITLAKYNRPLFEEDITARDCGPYVNELDVYIIQCRFDIVKNKFPKDAGYILPPCSEKIVQYVIEKYGAYTREELANMSSSEPPYKKAYINGISSNISQEEMKKYFKENIIV